MARGEAFDRRNHRPGGPKPPAVVAPRQSGPVVQFFHEAEPSDMKALYVSQYQEAKDSGPRMLQSHGWLDGELLNGSLEEVTAGFDEKREETWPLVRARHDISFVTRLGQYTAFAPRRVPLSRIRAPSPKPPALSLMFVRWGGKHRIGDGPQQNEGDGGWGDYGCPPCDWYIAAVVKEGVFAHPVLSKGLDVEIFGLFVRGSRDVRNIIPMAPWLAECMHGVKKASFWMLWPAEWEDFDDPDYAGYVERHAFFSAMRYCQASGIRSSFPHPADQYELLTSKQWLATLCMQPRACLPAAVQVSKVSYMTDPRRACKNALAGLEYIRAQNPWPDDGTPAPSIVNKDKVTKGAVKLGWSWEAQWVSLFSGEKELREAMDRMIVADGCLASTCIVQEWVDFDFEMRFYLFPPADWTPETRITPRRIEFNCWGTSKGHKPGSFHKLTEQRAIEERWEGDAEAMASAQAQAIDAANFLLAYLLTVDAEPVPMLRMDFMLRRLGPGQARVIFGEFCEAGACSLGWQEGPPNVWRACLDYAMR